MNKSNGFVRIIGVIQQPENVFLLLALLFGYILLCITPPGQVPDEYQHFQRAYRVSNGQWFGWSGEIPRQLVNSLHITSGMPFHVEKKINAEDLIADWYEPLDTQDTVLCIFPASSVYTPFPYLFSAAGISLGRWVNSPLAVFYLGRLFNLLAWIILGYLCLSITPVYKWVFLALLLTPMSLSQAASYSVDGWANALSFLFIALCLWLAMKAKAPIPLSTFLPLVFLAALLPLTKIPYASLVSIAFIIPAAKFASPKDHKKAIIILLLFTIASMIAASTMDRNFYESRIPFSGVNPAEQIKNILTQPLGFLEVVWRTVVTNIVHYSQSYIGVLGWLDTYLPAVIYPAFYLLLALAALFDHPDNIHISLPQKAILLASGFLTLIVVFTSLYITWTPVGESVINGIQGRYFIPAGPPLILLFYNRKIKTPTAIWRGLLIAFLVVVLVVTVITLLNRYYITSIG